MKRWCMWVATAALAAGCGDTGVAGGDGGAAGARDTGASAGGGCPTQTEITFGAATRGTTASGGWTQNLSSWFAQSDVACVPATMGPQFPSPYAVFSLQQPRTSDWDVVVTPDAGVDVNVIAWQQSSTDATCFPTRGIGVVSCEYSRSGGASGAETIRLQATTNPYRMVILVTTPQGGARGGFSVTVRNHG